MRKDADDRKDELIGAAESLFSEKGFNETSIDDICEKVEVAHGLFYYYFDSKEGVIEAITERMIKELVSNLEVIVKRNDLRADEKFKRLLNLSFQKEKKKPYLASYYFREESPKLFYNLFERSNETLTPYLIDIVDQGVEEGIFRSEYPEQTVRFWLNGRLFLFDRDRLEGKKFFEDIKAEAYLLERLLGIEDDFLTAFYEKNKIEIENFIEEISQGD